MIGWKQAPLGELAETQLGKMLDQKKNVGEYRRYLGNDNVQWNYLKMDVIKEMRFRDSELERFRLHRGDLLVCEGGDPGRCALWESNDEFYYQKALHRVRVGKDLDSRFLLYYLMHIGKTREIQQYYTGSATIKHLPAAALNRVVVRYPSLAVQRRIAGELLAFDRLIENNRKRIALLEEAAQRLYKEWFVDLRFPGFETTPVHNDLPEGWKKGPLLTWVNYIRGRSYAAEDLRDNDASTLINLNNIAAFGGWNAGAEKPYSGTFKPNQMVASGDIIMAVTDMTKERRLVGHVARIPKDASGGVISMDLIKLISAVIEPNYLYAYLRFSGIAKVIAMLANGTNVLHLKPEELNRVDLIVPTQCVQASYANRVQPFFDAIESAERQIAAAREARDRLLPKLMSGEIEVI